MVPGGRTGVSPVTLVVVVILAMISGTIAFVQYTRTVKLKQQLTKATDEANVLDAEIQRIVSETGEIRNFLENKSSAEAVQAYFKELDMRGIVADPKNFHKINMDLDLWIMRLDRLMTELDKRVAEAGKQADSAEAARDNTRNDYNRRVQQKNDELAKLGQFLLDELAKKENLVTQYVKEKKEFIDKYNNARDEWDGKKQRLLVQTDQLTRRNAVIRRELRILRPEPEIATPSGRVIRCEWTTKKVVINLGERDGVFPGLGFEVYYIDANGRHIVKGKIEVATVLKTSSVAAIIEGSPIHPIVAGDAIRTLFLPIPKQQKFVIAGFIPPGAIYNKDQITALIKLNGGEVQPAVTLYTDVLILGETAPSGLVAMDEKLVGVAQNEYRRGRSEVELARELSIDIVDYLEFLQAIQR
ncbi:MAG: hypothetical protein AMS16_02840 [Planctomycetes bacterium DG_58]|nr:MAG: hypothetical protein AMS16_02840 [Planctomycetes bacterium DG_58]KPL00395.1 MAG: hypothetical protein AMK75_05385 [Planctomycetes bacterium SM23_65]